MGVVNSFGLWRYWLFRANLNYKLRYRNSKLGMFWPALSLLVLSSVIGLVWGVLLEKINLLDYFLYVLSGYPVWAIVSSSVEQGGRKCSTNYDGIPFFTLVLERMAIVFIPFFYVLPLIFVVSLTLNDFQISHFLLFPVIISIMALWVLGIISSIIAITSWLPDFKHFVSSIMRLAFLATPIIWEVDRLGEYKKYIWFNPFYVPLESVRITLSGLSSSTPELFFLFFLYSVAIFFIGLLLLKLRN